MLPWIKAARREMTIRSAENEDRPAIARMLADDLHGHHHPGWQPASAWIGRATALVAEHRFGLAGCLIAPADPPPASWLRGAAVSDGGHPAGVMIPLLTAGLAELAALKVETISAMPVAMWLPPILDELGFAVVEEVETWFKDDLQVQRRGDPALHVRPVQESDLQALAAIEVAAFPPRWRTSAGELKHAQRQALSFTVAEWNERPVGFQISMADKEHAHLVRLTVDPTVQGHGVGTRLLAATLEDYAQRNLSAVSLNTQTENLASQRLYRAFGFRQLGYPLPVWERPV